MRKKKQEKEASRSSAGLEHPTLDTDFYASTPTELPLYQDGAELDRNRVRVTDRHQHAAGLTKDKIDPREKMALLAILKSLVMVLMLGNIGISSVGTLFAAIVQLTNTRGSLLSVLVLTILMPMMIPATLALLILFGAVPAELVGTGALAFVGDLHSAIGYMIAFDAVFVVACWLLFGFAIKE